MFSGRNPLPWANCVHLALACFNTINFKTLGMFLFKKVTCIATLSCICPFWTCLGVVPGSSMGVLGLAFLN